MDCGTDGNLEILWSTQKLTRQEKLELWTTPDPDVLPRLEALLERLKRLDY